MKCKVSICIPAYNKPSLIERLLNSINDQSFKDFEVIVTDDSETENVHDVVMKFDDKFRIIYKKNIKSLGSPLNWNEGLQYASGLFIKPMHHDDWFENKTCLSELVKSMEENKNSCLCIAKSYNYDENKNLISINKVSDKILKLLNRYPDYVFYGNCIGAPSAVIYRNNEILYDHRLKWLVDIDHYIRLIKDGGKVYFNPKAKIGIGIEGNRVTDESFGNKNVEFYENIVVFNKLSHNYKNFLRDFIYLLKLLSRLNIKKNEYIELSQEQVIPRIITNIYKYNFQKISSFFYMIWKLRKI